QTSQKKGSYYYHYDGIGAVTGLTDSVGNLIQSYTYDAYGNLLRSKGNVENLYRFSTKELLPKSGLIYFGARYYDPRIGRFITPDPLTWGPDDPRLFGNLLTPSTVIRDSISINKGILDPRITDIARTFKESQQRIILQVGEALPHLIGNRYVYCANNPVNYIDLYGLARKLAAKILSIASVVVGAIGVGLSIALFLAAFLNPVGLTIGTCLAIGGSVWSGWSIISAILGLAALALSPPSTIPGVVISAFGILLVIGILCPPAAGFAIGIGAMIPGIWSLFLSMADIPPPIDITPPMKKLVQRSNTVVVFLKHEVFSTAISSRSPPQNTKAEFPFISS
ncbi:MAG: RHS repeat-associated core domain-containing protein, partial [Nitrospirota bacterium]